MTFEHIGDLAEDVVQYLGFDTGKALAGRAVNKNAIVSESRDRSQLPVLGWKKAGRNGWHVFVNPHEVRRSASRRGPTLFLVRVNGH